LARKGQDMSARGCSFLICISAVMSLLPASSQVSMNQTVTVQMSNPGRTTRLPYLAEFKTTQVRTLADGSTVTDESTEVVAVDSQGRRLTATTTAPSSGDVTPKTRFTVIDPMAHVWISWASPGKIATVAAIPIPAAAQCSYAAVGSEIVTLSCAGSRTTQTPTSTFLGSIAKRLGFLGTHNAAGLGCASGTVIPTTKSTVEDLGTTTIHGVEARGQRTTTTAPGVAIQNIPPQVTAFEVWTAIDPGLRGLVVRQLNDSSRSGKMSRELVKFARSEPDSSIFQVPRGYEIVNREVAIDYCPTADELEPATATAH
jgi:hypothetical protein